MGGDISMAAYQLEFGLIGVGKMGGGLAYLALDKGMNVIGYSRGGVAAELKRAGMTEIAGAAEFRDHLEPPRVVLLYVPAGPAVDSLLDDLEGALEPGDIIADGGNSYWGDSFRRHRRLKDKGIDFLDVGTSGGLSGARHGACFMVGGEGEPVLQIEPVLHALATKGGYVHAGPPGAGHFVKLVHNGIEFGMLQAIAEGFDLLTHFEEPVDIGAVLEAWRHGSVIRSWLVDLIAEAYRADPELERPSSYVEDTGEVNWLVRDALRMEVPIPVISQSVMQLFASRDEKKNWARAIVMMRHAFGGHPLGPDDDIARERSEGRAGNA
ncbi:MAG: decarboxylating 6-phosphogluconate dehydrogenase [Woeseia sp.]